MNKNKDYQTVIVNSEMMELLLSIAAESGYKEQYDHVLKHIKKFNPGYKSVSTRLMAKKAQHFDNVRIKKLARHIHTKVGDKYKYEDFELTVLGRSHLSPSHIAFSYELEKLVYDKNIDRSELKMVRQVIHLKAGDKHLKKIRITEKH